MSSLFRLVGRIRRETAQRSFREWSAFLVVVIGFCGSIVYTDVQTFTHELASTEGYSDAKQYMDVYSGIPVTGLRSYRPLVPFLAHFVPPPPRALYSADHGFDQFSIVAARFAVLNLLFLIGTCILLLIYQKGFGIDHWTAFLGVLLFLGTENVVLVSGVPMVEAAFYFFFLLSLIAVQRNNVWLLLLAMTIGVTAKELVLLTIPMIILSTVSLRSKGLMLAASAPSLAVLAIVVARSGNALSAGGFAPLDIGALANPKVAFELIVAFGLAWIPAGYALLRVDVPPLLKRWSWLLPLVLAVALVAGASWSRSAFMAFPAVVPLAALGLAEWVRRGTPTRARARSSAQES
jgi:hypothetical protein